MADAVVSVAEQRVVVSFPGVDVIAPLLAAANGAAFQAVEAAEVATQKAAEAEGAVAVAVTPLLGATFGGLEDWGAAGLTPGITSVPANRLMISDAPAGRQGTMEMSVTLAKPGRIVIFILNRVDGDSWTLAFARANDLPAGRSDLKDWLPEVGAAQHVAVLATTAGVLTYSSGGSETMQLYDGVPGGSFDSTATLTSVTPCWSWTVREGSQPRMARLERYAADDLFGTETPYGTWPSAGLGALLNADTTVVSLQTFQASGQIGAVDIAVSAATDVAIWVANIVEPGVYRIDETVSPWRGRLPVGANVISNWQPVVRKGQVLAIWSSAQALSYVASGSSGSFRFKAGPADGDGLITTAGGIDGAAVSFGWTIINGAERRLEAASRRLRALSDTGLDALLNAPVSPANATGDFARAWTRHPHPYVPPGDYAVTNLPCSGDGFWGPGRVFWNGTLVPLADAPRQPSPLLRLRSALSDQIASGSPLVVIGDSLSTREDASVPSRHWVERLNAFTNLATSPNSLPATTLLSSEATWFGITLSGATRDGRGPVADAINLSAGGYAEFTGPYARLAIWRSTIVGGGDLVVTRNGVTVTTLSTAGTAADDVLEWVTSSSASSATWRLTATGGPVLVSGLYRQGASAAGGPAPLRVLRASHGGWKASAFTDARLDSVITMAEGLGPRPMYLVALGSNDMLDTGTGRLAAHEANMNRILDRLQARPGPVALISPVRPGGNWDANYEAGAPFEAFVGLQTRIARAASLPILRLDEVDVFNRSLMPNDALHWSDGGNELAFRRVVDFLGGL